MRLPTFTTKMRVTLVAGLIALGGLLVVSRAQVYSTLPSMTNLSGVTCTSCTMDGMTVNSPITIDGATFKAVLRGTTGSIGGGLLAIGCTSGTASVSGAAVGMVASATPNTFPGNNIQWQAYVSSANVVTVSVCTSLTLTPAASAYNVSVVQ